MGGRTTRELRKRRERVFFWCCCRLASRRRSRARSSPLLASSSSQAPNFFWGAEDRADDLSAASTRRLESELAHSSKGFKPDPTGVARAMARGLSGRAKALLVLSPPAPPLVFSRKEREGEENSGRAAEAGRAPRDLGCAGGKQMVHRTQVRAQRTHVGLNRDGARGRLAPPFGSRGRRRSGGEAGPPRAGLVQSLRRRLHALRGF